MPVTDGERLPGFGKPNIDSVLRMRYMFPPMVSEVLVTFAVDGDLWDEGRIRYTCSICGGSDDGGPTSNPSVQTEMRQHLKKKHRLSGTSLLRSETRLDDRGAISTVEFRRN